MKKFALVPLVLLLLGVISSTAVHAVTITPTNTPAQQGGTTVTPSTTAKNTANSQLTALQNRTLGEVERRITSLQAVVEKIAMMKHVSEAEKATFTAAIETEITKLTDLKTKVSTSSDLQTLKADVATITSQYRIFALLVPKMHLLSAADTLSQTIAQLTILSEKLDTRITEAESAGMSVTRLKTTHANMLEKIADAKKQYESIITNVTPLTPDGYPGNKSTLTNARGLLATARKNLTGASTDARSIMTSLKAFRPIESTKSASPTASTSATQ